MAFSDSQGQGPMSEINVTPLVDVMLVLLIVFIITAPLLMQAVTVDLPETAPVAPVESTRTVQLTIDAQGDVFVDRQPVAMDQLEEALTRLHATQATLGIQLHADENVRYGRVAEVMAAVSRAGIGKLGFITIPR